MKVVVTGASGFLGRTLCQTLRDAQVETVGVDRVERRDAPVTIVRNAEDAPAGDVLVHLGENADLGLAERLGQSDFDERVSTVEALLRARKWERLVYVSSGVVLGDQISTPRAPIETVSPGGVYARGKVACEERVLASGRGVVARLGNVYGRGMATNNVMSDLIAALRAPERPARIRSLTPVRDFIHVSDVVRGLQAMLGGPTGLFHLASGVGTSVRALSELIARVLNVENSDVVETQPSARASTLVLDIEDTTKAFGWRPKVTLLEGLRHVVEGHSAAV